MAISEWIPLAAGALAVYWGTTRMAGLLMRSKDANGEDDDTDSHSTKGALFGLSFFKRPEPSAHKRASNTASPRRARSSSGSSAGPSAHAGSSRSGAAPAPIPVVDAVPLAQRKAVNKEIAAKIEQAAGVLNRGPDTLPMDLADPKLTVDGQGPMTRSDIDLGDGPIGSLDFTLDDSPGPHSVAVDLHAGDSPTQNSAEDIGKTLLLDTEELMKAIRRGPAGNLPLPAVAAPAASTAEAVAPVAAPASEDWSAALDGIKDWQIEATTPSFFSAPQAGRDMGTTQAFRLDQSTLTAPKARAASFAPAVGSPASSSPVDAESSSATEFAAPDLQLPDLVYQPKATAAPATRINALGSHPLGSHPLGSHPLGSNPRGSIPRGANESFHESPQERDNLRDHFAHRPGRNKPIERVRVESIEHEEFRDLAIAHDDIQSARVVFEEVRQMFGGAADPIFRALVFGAIVSYCRPFQRLSQHPALAAFSTSRFKKAHQELAVAHQRLVQEDDTSDDEVVRMFRDGAGDENDGMSFAVRTSLLNEQRLPLYIALCNALEMKLLEHLQVIGEQILGPAPARELDEPSLVPDEVARPASSVSEAELDALVAPAMYLSQPVKTMTTH